MEISVVSEKNTAAGQVEVSEAVFGASFNESLVHQAVVAFQARGRQGSKAQKSRSDVTGGGAKPWRQKGTGRARSGTRTSPIWRSGGVTFAATPKTYNPKLNKKMYRGAMRSLVSELASLERLVVLEDLSVEAPKTKLLIQKLDALNATSALIVDVEPSEPLYLSARNIPHIEVVGIDQLNPVNLISYEKVLITKAAVQKVSERLAA